MCSPEKCSRCTKTTWKGCGQHIDAVMNSVAQAQRCTCPPRKSRSLLQRLRNR